MIEWVNLDLLFVRIAKHVRKLVSVCASTTFLPGIFPAVLDVCVIDFHGIDSWIQWASK